jgi:hypothetical protein
MGKHSNQYPIINDLLRDDDWGIDFGNVELKTSKSKSLQFTLYPKDNLAQFIVFYSWNLDIFLFVNQTEMPKIKTKRNFTVNQIRNFAYLETGNIEEIKKELEEIIKHPYIYCKWLAKNSANEQPN